MSAPPSRPFDDQVYMVINLSPNCILVVDADGCIAAVNNVTCTTFGYEEQALIGQTVELLMPERFRARHYLHRLEYAASPRRRPMGVGLDLVGRRRDGSEFPIELSLSPMPVGDRWYVMGVGRDITERLAADTQLRALLHEQDMLLKEVHHRVKNNLQIVSSLMNLQKRSVTDPHARIAIEDARSRIRTMALIHEILYKANRVSSIELSSYTRKLVHEIARSFGTATHRIEWNIKLEKVRTNIDTAISLGLVMNELLSNCLQHAFRGRDSGLVTICLQRTSCNIVTLTVADNGVGLPSATGGHGADALGLQLVRNLVTRLPGELRTISTTEGTCFGIEFEATEADPQ